MISFWMDDRGSVLLSSNDNLYRPPDIIVKKNRCIPRVFLYKTLVILRRKAFSCLLALARGNVTSYYKSCRNYGFRFFSRTSLCGAYARY